MVQLSALFISSLGIHGMTDSHQFDELLRNWPYEVDALGVRRVTCADDREVLQMRVDMGVLQLELEGRPDGTSPDGFVTFYDYLLGEFGRYGDEMVLDDDQCNEVDREFIQFYQRRICWLRLQEYHNAVRDAEHTLRLMDFCRKHSPDEEWTLSHEQQRPFVLFHRTQAAALLLIDESGPDTAISEINKGLDELRTVFEEFEVEDQYETDEFVARLQEFREALRTEYEVGRTLNERLEDAVAAEQYELAAQLRDELAKRRKP